MNVNIHTVAVIGCGYIGLPTAAMLASRGIFVTAVDIDEQVVSMINSGKIHIVEPDLESLVHSVVSSGYLRAQTTTPAADVFIITVPTPFKDQHQPDLSYIEAAVQNIAPVLQKNNLVILESTSPVNTTARITEQFVRARKDLIFPNQGSDSADINIAYCPERVMPGQIIRELIENDRIIGGITTACTLKATQLYQLFVKGACIATDAKTAEMVKLTENAFRDVNIAFANELSMICDKLDINVWQLIQLANHHPRVNILQPGPGVGGHCVAVDPWFIVHAAKEEAKLISKAREVNSAKPHYIVEKIKQAAATLLPPQQATIAFLGLSYKANTDDLRESPALTVLEELSKSTSFALNIVEPHITELPSTIKHRPQIKLLPLAEALKTANIIVMMVAHSQFKGVLEDSASLANKKIIQIVNMNPEAKTTSTSTANKKIATQLSEYDVMMMNAIYGNILR